MRSYLYETQLLVAAVAALVLFAFGQSDETYLAGKSLDLSVMQAEQQPEQRAEDFKADLRQSLADIQAQAESAVDALAQSLDLDAASGSGKTPAAF